MHPARRLAPPTAALAKIDARRAQLAETLRDVEAAQRALAGGDPEPYMELWDDGPDVTLYDAHGPIERGAAAVRETYAWIGTRFTGGELVPGTIVVHVSGSLACTVGFERGEVSTDGGPPRPMTTRVTQVYRHFGGKWHLVHRHADFPPRDPRLE
jgi:ketosteroid isomerase-like protein